MNKKNKTYFVADVHLGSFVFSDSLEREKRLVRWLDSIRDEAKALFLLGDIFDFWFEYKEAVPRGFTRFLGKLAELSDNGMEIHYCIGNHDLWIFDYLPREIGLILHKNPVKTEIDGKIFYVAHGDGLGERSRSFKLIRRIFHNRICQILFRALHPDCGIGLAHLWARHSRQTEQKSPKPYFGEEKENLLHYSQSYLQTHPEIDYFVFGHRHILLDKPLNSKSRIMFIGDWLKLFSYAVFDGKELTFKRFEE